MGKYEQLEDPEEADTTAVVVKSEKRCIGDSLKVLVIGILVFGVAVTIGLIVDINYLRKPIRHTAIVTEAPECTAIASDILKLNDNVVDAAIAAIVCLTVVQPDQCSLAGGGFMLIRNNSETNSLDFQYSTPRQFGDTDVVAVPGLLPGLKAAHKKYGKLAFEKLLQPSIELANSGFNVSNSTVVNIQQLPVGIRNYFRVDGRPLKIRDVLKLPLLSELLTSIANENSSLHDEIIAAVRTHNGSMSLDDFKQYKATWKKPLETMINNNQVVTTDLPSSGVLLLSALKLLNEFPNVNTSIANAVIAHVLEVILPKYDLVQDPVSSQSNETLTVISDVKAKEYAMEIRRQLNEKKQTKVTKHLHSGTLQKKASATVSVINLKGDMVSIVTSLGDVFGARMITKTGVILNNGLTSLSKHGKTNTMLPSKRPSSFASPAFILNGEMTTSLAPSANEEGLAAVIQVMKRILIDGSNETLAVNYPRLFFDRTHGDVHIEGQQFSKLPSKYTIDLLKSQFVKVSEVETIGNVNVAFKTKTTNAIVDSRL